MRRPLSFKKPMLLVLQSAVNDPRYSLHKKAHAAAIELILKRQSKKFQVRLLEKKISATRVELLLRIYSRPGFQQFLRSITALIARKITQARRGHAFGKFWLGLAYTRLIRLRAELRAFYVELFSYALNRLRQSGIDDP